MATSIIEELLRSTPKQRKKKLLALHDKNIRMFMRFNRELGEFVAAHESGPFEIRINEDFLDIVHGPSGQPIHPWGQAADYYREMGQPHHTGWIDFTEVKPVYQGQSTEQGRRTLQFVKPLQEIMPDLAARMATGEIALPRTQDGRRYSGATLFLGIFSGLHIAHFLARSEICNAVFIEPDIERFLLSTYFLDYEAIQNRLGRLVLHVGEEVPKTLPNMLIADYPATSSAWVRVLQGYPSEDFDRTLDDFKMRWRQLVEIMVPFDREVRNLTYAARNIHDKRLIWAKRPELSAASRIAVVASGPSLENDIEWLKANRERLVIMAAHSAVRVLMRNDIRPDFQCNLETELTEELLDKLSMEKDIPLLNYYKADPALIERFDRVLLVTEVGKANPVFWKAAMNGTHPTTGNLAVSVALHCQPKEVYLLGLDLSYRDIKRTHVKGSWYDDNEGAGHRDFEGRELIPAPANFTEGGETVSTTAYHNVARSIIETMVARQQGVVKVYNLSDGVGIAGAEPRRSSDIELEAYPQRADDLASIDAAFLPGGGVGEGWLPYATSGAELWRKMRDIVVKRMTLKRFDWLAFSKALDGTWDQAFQNARDKDLFDFRMEAYHQLISSLLSDWYRTALFARNPKEAEKIYDMGLKNLKAVLDEVAWPDELDEYGAVSVDAKNVSSPADQSAKGSGLQAV